MLLRAQGAYFSINGNSHEMYMMLPGNDVKFPIIVADDSTPVMRLEVLLTPGVEPVPSVSPGPGGETVVVRTSQSHYGQLHP